MKTKFTKKGKERQAYPVGGSLLADDDNSSADVRLCVDERGR